MPLETRVLLKFDRFSGFISEFSSNVSQGGMFIRTRTPEPVGTVLDFGFRLGDDYELIHGRGEVVWIRAQDQASDRPAGMGIRFLELSAGSRELIRKMVENFVQAGGTPFDVSQAQAPPPADAGGAADPAPGVPDALPGAAEPPAAPEAALVPEPEAVGLEVEEEPWAAPADALPPVLPALEEGERTPAPLPGEPLSTVPELQLADEDPAPPAPTGPVRGPWPVPAAAGEEDALPGALPDLEPEPALPEPEARERTPLPWPVAAAGEPAPRPAPDSPFGPLPAPLAPSSRSPRPIDLPPRPAPPVFQAAAAPSSERSRRLMLAGAAVAVLVLVAAVLLLARGPLRGFLRLPGTATASPEVPPPPAGPAAEPAPPAPSPEIVAAGEAEEAGTTAEPAPEPASAAPDDENGLSAAVPPPPTPAPAPPTPAPAPAPAAPFGAVERITWEQAGGATDLLLWLDGAVRRSDYQQFRVGEPAREVVKLIGVRRPFPQARLEVGTAQVRQLRIGFHDKPGGDELHVVIDLADPGARITGIQEEPGRLRVRIQ